MLLVLLSIKGPFFFHGKSLRAVLCRFQFLQWAFKQIILRADAAVGAGSPFLGYTFADTVWKSGNTLFFRFTPVVDTSKCHFSDSVLQLINETIPRYRYGFKRYLRYRTYFRILPTCFLDLVEKSVLVFISADLITFLLISYIF